MFKLFNIVHLVNYFSKFPLIWKDVLNRRLYHQFETKDTIFQMEVVLMMLLALKDCVGIDRDRL